MLIVSNEKNGSIHNIAQFERMKIDHDKMSIDFSSKTQDIDDKNVFTNNMSETTFY